MDYEGFKRGVLNLSGIDLGYYKEKQTKRRINSIMRKNAFESYNDYYSALTEDESLYRQFINYLTINVSEFYRNPGQWQVLKEDILPLLLKDKNSLSIWSCACSTGDEPYTLAMILSRLDTHRRIRILATDLDTEAIEKAKKGLYTKKSVEKLPFEYTEEFFETDGTNFSIKQNIKENVIFKRLNLLSDDYPAGYDLIVCRNVLIYFTNEAKHMVLKKISSSLNKGGILFVGSTEQVLMPQKYDFYPMKTFFYRKGF